MSHLGIGWYMASIKTERLMRTQDLGIVDVVSLLLVKLIRMVI